MSERQSETERERESERARASQQLLELVLLESMVVRLDFEAPLFCSVVGPLRVIQGLNPIGCGRPSMC